MSLWLHVWNTVLRVWQFVVGGLLLSCPLKLATVARLIWLVGEQTLTLSVGVVLTFWNHPDGYQTLRYLYTAVSWLQSV